MSSPSSVLQSAHILVAGGTKWTREFSRETERRTEASVQVVPTVEAALDILRDRSIDCIVTEFAFEESTGIELIEAVRAETTTLPVILCTAAGDESVASEAIAAGVTDYVVFRDPFDAMLDELLERTERSVRSAHREMTQRDRARQFDAIFHDSRTATWVLDSEGALIRANETARDMVDVAIDTVVGDPFWTLPWWTERDGLRSDVRRITDRARSGTFGNAIVMQSSLDDDSPVIDLSARPVRDERGDIVSIVVEGVDITDRVNLERDLRRSEELHRVTLNNMTDTVLITDESGEYTYVCPNVHFIFGYTAEEIREMGTIDELLGEDVLDRETLAADGVLKNIECTATDKAGREHTLLVNIRRVSIQDGTVLFSCRDITKRKQREDALATLQETARDFLYAETKHEVAQHIVDDTPEVLDLEASAVYLFDADENALDPVAHSPEMDRLNGPLRTVPADGTGITGSSFLEDEARFYDDVHDADRLENQATGIRSAAYIPLGDHGVFVVGSPDVDRFDPVIRELTDLLAATAEAALDRVVRENRLREQDRALQRQNTRLSAMNRVNEIIREIDQALVRAETQAEIDHAVCELLTADDRYAFAWIGVVDAATETVGPRAWSGAEQGYLDSVSIGVDDAGMEPAGRTAATRDVTMVSNVAAGLREEPWRKEALVRDYLSVLSVPLAYDELSYGVLTVYANSQDAFDETSRAVLAELGETIASATSAIERKNALLTTSMTRLEFEIDDPTFVLSRLAQRAECELSYQGGVQHTDAGSSVFVSVDNAEGPVFEQAAAELVAINEIQRISADGTEGRYRLRLSQPFLALELADHGAVLRSASIDASTTTLVIDVPDTVDVRPITDLVTNSFSHVALRSKRTLDRSSTRDLYGGVLDQLTDRQLEVLQTAYYSGFFEAPRESTGEEIAETLDISPTAFYQHARTVQRKLFATLFDEIGVPTTIAET